MCSKIEWNEMFSNIWYEKFILHSQNKNYSKSASADSVWETEICSTMDFVLLIVSLIRSDLLKRKGFLLFSIFLFVALFPLPILSYNTHRDAFASGK